MFRRNNRIWHKGLAFMSSSIGSYQTRWYNKIILRKGYSFSRDFSWIENYKLKSFCQWKFLLTKFLSVRYPSTLGLFVSFFCLFVLFTFSKKFITLLDKIFPDMKFSWLFLCRSDPGPLIRIWNCVAEYIRSSAQFQILWLLIFNNLR